MKKLKSLSEGETRKIAKSLAEKLNGVIALTGELGAGKTTFVQGFAQGLGIKDKIISPTFVLIRQHKIPHGIKTLYHIDLYRLEDSKDLKNLGIEEILSNSDNIVLIEWAEKIKTILPKNTTYITLNRIDERFREIKVNQIS